MTHVEADSPLSMHLPVGSFLTTLDDLPLNSSRDTWSTYLLEPTPAAYKRGWCVDMSRLSDDHQCCVDAASSPSCFVSFESAMEEYCTDPVAVLSKIENRCDSSASCLESQSCIKPRGDRDILRITVNYEETGPEDERVVLWSGPRYEVWEQGMIHEFKHVWLMFTFMSSYNASRTAFRNCTTRTTPRTRRFLPVSEAHKSFVISSQLAAPARTGWISIANNFAGNGLHWMVSHSLNHP